uniref:Uncharacterized protein n=1 Tax=Zea mays TaxID=4577 RepID=B6TVV2_MAIZE|nr:hypothetical protein [Zea mays]
MRIRRRPPGQPLAYLLPSDPSAAPQSPPRASSIDRQERPPPPPGGKQGEGELHLHPATNDSPAPADLEDGRSRSSALRRPALLPQLQEQDDAVEQRSRCGGLGAQQRQRQGPSDGRSSLDNGRDCHVPEPVTIQAGERRLSNGVGAAAVATTTTATAGAKATRQQQEAKQDTGGGARRAARALQAR